MDRSSKSQLGKGSIGGKAGLKLSSLGSGLGQKLSGAFGGKLSGALTASVGGSARSQTLSPIAVDFGESSLKLLQIEHGQTPKLIAAACIPTPDALLENIHQRLDYQIAELPKVIKAAGFKGKRAVCAIPASQTFCKHLQLGRAGPNERDTVIQQLLGEELGRDPASLVYRSYDVRGVIGANASRNEVVVMAACRGLVGRLMNGLKAAKLDVVGMHNEWTAELHSFARFKQREQDSKIATLYLDMGSGGARVSVAHGNDLVFARSLEVGGRLFDEAYAAHYGLAPNQGRTERLRTIKPIHVERGVPVGVGGGSQGIGTGSDRREGGAAPGLSHTVESSVRDVDPALRDSFEILADEISMCVRYHESLFGPRRLNGAVFFGGEARDGTLCRRVAGALRVPTQIADPFSVMQRDQDSRVMGFESDAPQPAWVLALGLCESPTEL